MLEQIYEELGRSKIGGALSEHPGDRLFYEAVTRSLIKAPARGFKADLKRLPHIFFLSEEVKDIGIKPRPAWLQLNDGWGAAEPKGGEQALYWNGTELGARPHPGPERAWSEEYEDFANRVVSVAAPMARSPVIVEIGAGTGAVTFHLADIARSRGLREMRFVNIERDAAALAFSRIFSDRYKLPINHILMDVGASLDRQSDLDELASRVHAEERPVIVITHGALHPFYTDEQYAKLFPYLVRGLNAVAGVHLERNGFRTATFENLRGRFRENTYEVHQQFTECASDPFEYLANNSANLGISIRSRQELFRHFPPRHAPSFMAWSRP